MTLEELLDDIVVASTMDYPESASVYVGIHHVNEDLLLEFVDAHPELIESKSLSYDGARIVRLHAADDRRHAVTLFTDHPAAGEW